MNEWLTANKWYPHYKGPNRLYDNPYPSPQSILRTAVGAEEYMFVSETVTTEHIRAAVIMPLDVPFQHLLADVPWGMSYRERGWRMLIVSVPDPYAWIELARASGAIGWMKTHAQTYTYNWEPPYMDEHGLKCRPPGTLKPRANEPRKRGRPQKFDRENLLADLHENIKAYDQLAKLHNISLFTVTRFAQMNGFKKRDVKI